MSELSDLGSPVREPFLTAAGVKPAPAPEAGIALCLSGGGYRAMIFHVGALWRLDEMRLLAKLRRVSSVSGGSITAAVLGLNWANLGFVDGRATRFADLVVMPIRQMANQSIDVSAVGWGLITPGKSISDEIIDYYRKYLFQDATLQDLPDEDDQNLKPPRFVINSTNVKSGVLWRFARPYMGDYRVGLIQKPTVPLAMAVAASSAFPPYLSPLRYKCDPAQFDPNVAADLSTNDYRSELVLTDGGVYDNLGLEPAWKRFDTILVSDGGRDTQPDPDPASDWARHSRRVIEIVQQQVASLRVRQLMDSLNAKKEGDPALNSRAGAYWSLRGVHMDIRGFPIKDPLPCPADRIAELANIPTRLAAMPSELQERLINWGYAVCDAAVRSYYSQADMPAPAFPYPAVGV